MIDRYSGLPLSLDAATGVLSFRDGLLCDGSSEKRAGQMKALFRRPEGTDEDALVYRAYRNIRFKEDEALFAEWGYRYDITVILPGDINGEFYKTSGHFHGVPEMRACPYPELYEVVQGEIAFVLQRNATFSQPDGGRVTQLQAVRVRAGQAIIVPPHCGHGSVNPTDEVSAFSNICVAACPIDYAPVRARGGLAACILRSDRPGEPFRAEPNPNYDALPEIGIAAPVENAALGVVFGEPCYQSFIRHPERYDFLRHPEKYMAEMDAMTRTIR